MNLCKSRVISPIGDITLFTIVNSSGALVTLSSMGAGVVSIKVPNRNGIIEDVALGYPNPKDYINDMPCAGKTIGRFANRISHARFCLDGVEYELTPNDGENSLHGGPSGFMNRIWTEEILADEIAFHYVSADGEEGYPGELKTTVVYKWTDDNELIISYRAVTDKTTIVNLTNHTYFNLNGENSGDILNHDLRLYASTYLPVTSSHIPTGEILPVAGIPMDFLTLRKVGRDFNADFDAVKIGRGYNHYWILDDVGQGNLHKCADLYSEDSGRLLEVYTTHRGVQVYTGGWLEGSPIGHGGYRYANHAGIALECQGYTDSPNHDNFPVDILRPGEIYEHQIVYRFNIR